MTRPKANRKGYSKVDIDAVSDNPEWTEKDFAKARPFTEAFPGIASTIRKGRGPNKAPTKKLISLRLSPAVIEHFKAKGEGWQAEIDKTLAKVAGVRMVSFDGSKRAGSVKKKTVKRSGTG